MNYVIGGVWDEELTIRERLFSIGIFFVVSFTNNKPETAEIDDGKRCGIE